MDLSTTIPAESTVAPLPNLELLMFSVSNVARLKILRELSLGEPREIAELASVGGCSYDSTLKHLSALVKAGLLERGRGNLYQIPKQYRVLPGQRILDFGYCVLRLEKIEG
jgi:DNA-binding transcriptional ArsR family regulator